ncbi:translation initiation factor IF-2 [Erysipelothrix larvae]|uniref:Translation initiation factor IF-2 n=1 Tax=Erysipelothrix larvae TaxID=1514105 RepID=A0A0X8GZJ1_9FIRM|nr:translation initiation factor IF-2 [Erysipelothrix larvae]AMC93325.1 translation initiation factor IF-2 [Erysipelothrix larvae]
MSQKKKNKRVKGRGNQSRNKSKNPASIAPKKKVPTVTEIEYFDGITVTDLAERLERSPSELIKLLFLMGTVVTINSSLDSETVELICMEYNVTAQKVEVIDELALDDDIQDDPKDLKPRPPIITIMGHVDHGKTTLLDTIRKTNVVSDEFGGITQHIGAYQIRHNNQLLTFLDTPGHQAFTAMRARGAKVTDLVIIVVAADDGMMPQTREAIDHAKVAEVPMIVAINKIDKPGANFDRIYSEFADAGITPEEWGGDTVFAKISAKTGEGIEDLLETILVATELEELSANPNRTAIGTVIEAKLDKGRGPVATLLVQNGTLHVGDPLVVGSIFARIRKMTDSNGRELVEALPSMPVEIIGLQDVPTAGDLFKSYDSEKRARFVAEKRNIAKVEADRSASSAMSLDDLSRQIAEGAVQDINIILKADVQGSAEALKSSLEQLSSDEIRVNVIRATAGTITENDILLATASHAVIIGFNIRPTSAVRKVAEEQGVDIRLYNVIYQAIEAIESAMKGMMAPVFEEVIYGQAEVREIFKASSIGTIAGSMVVDGKIFRDGKCRLIRDGVVIYDGKVLGLKRFKDDAKTVSQGYECGITIENFNDIKVGDVIEAYGEEEIAQD